MMFAYVSPLTLLACLVVYEILGFVWYSPALFGKTWARLVHIDPTHAKRRMPAAFAISAFSCLLTSFGFVQIFALLSVTMVSTALLIAFWIWLFFHFFTLLTHYLFDGRSLGVFVIVAAHDLVWMLAMAAVVVLM